MDMQQYEQTDSLPLPGSISQSFNKFLTHSNRKIHQQTASFLSRKFSISLKVSTLVIVAFIVGFIGWAFLRYRLQTRYSRLPADEAEEQGPIERWLKEEDTDVQGISNEKQSYTSYFDEFLSAIQVFGYLDKEVFHELTRHMRTHRIDKGESIPLNDLKGFALVIDGSVDVYYSDEGKNKSDKTHWRKIAEVGHALPLSSIFSVLSLFTENLDLDATFANPPGVPEHCKYTLDSDDEGTNVPKPEKSDFDKFRESVIAVGKVETTIAVIPAESFHKVTQSYPLPAANIIQIMLLRWSRVTQRSLGSFIDLMGPMFSIESRLASSIHSPIPLWLKDAVMRKFEKVVPEEPNRDVHSLPRHQQIEHHHNQADSLFGHNSELSTLKDQTYPGDLLSNVPLSSDDRFGESLKGISSASQSGAVSRKLSLAESLDKYSLQRDSSHSTELDRRNSFIVNCNLSGDERLDNDNSTLRRLLAKHIFEILGLHTFNIPASTPQSRRPSRTKSERGGLEPLNESSLGLIMNPFNARSEEAIPVNSAPQFSYTDLVNQAANLLDIMQYKKGALLSKERSRTRGLFLIIEGTVNIDYTRNDSKKHLREAHAGELVGLVETVSSYSTLVSITAQSDVCVAFISKSDFEKLGDRYPPLFIRVAKLFTHLMPRSLVCLDTALEWQSIKSGEVLFHENEQADSIYFILNGRIRYIKEPQKAGESGAELGHGSSLGQLECLLERPYQYTAVAVRETELARLPRVLVEMLPKIFPETNFELAKVVASSILKRQDLMSLQLNQKQALGYGKNIRTISIIPTTEGLPLNEFAAKLTSAFRGNNRDVHLVFHSQILQYLGRYAFSRMGVLKLKSYLSDLEQQYQTLILVAESSVKSSWTRLCIDRADCILLLADASTEPIYSEYERLIVKSRSSAKAHMVLIHQSSLVPPGSTQKWLKNRPWVTRHHHVQLHFSQAAAPSKPPKRNAGLQKLQKIRDRVRDELFIKKTKAHSSTIGLDHNKYAHKNDFSRLARILSGEAIGLVLGGGGARGISHVGVIKAIEEAGIPVDLIGGTSIGSFVGGLYAREHDLVPIYGRAKQFSSRMAAMWRMLLDLTYPAVSYTTGHAFNRGIWKTFGDSRLEDFWINYFCNSTNLTQSRMDIHTTGYAWRYIRASMSLAGLVPPIEDKGQMLLDGGYMDNLPVTEMLSLGAKHIIAVDVGSIDDTTEMDYGDTLSGMWVLFNRFNPFSNHPRLPSLAEIQARLAYVSSVKALELAKATPGVTYLRPPIEGYATLDFGKFDEIVAVGYAYAARKLRELNLASKFSNESEASPTRQSLQFRRHSI